MRRGFHRVLAVGLVLVAAAVAVLVATDRAPPPPSPIPVFPGLADRLGELAWVRLARGTMKVDFANVAGRWVVVEKDNYPADPGKFRGLLRGLAGLTRGPSETDAGGPILVVLRGRAGETVAEARLAAAPHPAGADPVPAGDLPGDPLDWLDRAIVDVPPERVAAIRLTAADGTGRAWQRATPDAPFVLVDPPAGAQRSSDPALAELSRALSRLVLDDVKPLAAVEFPQTATAGARFATFDGLAIELRLVARDGADWIAITASGAGAAAAESQAINDRLARWAYAIPAARARLLRTRPDDPIEPAKGL
jgi:hypothetical protein